MPLTDNGCKNAMPDPDGKIRKMSDALGLSLWVMPTGRKYWRMKYRHSGKEKLLAIGVYPETSLKAAREKRDEARLLLAEGTDPGAKRKEEKITARIAAVNTFEAIAREWHDKESHEWHPAHAANVIAAMERHIFPTIGARPVS